MKSNIYNISRTALGVLTAMLALPLAAQSYPSKPIRMIIPFSAGGAADVPGRIVTQKLTESLKQQVLVDNRPGAGSTIGADAAAKAAPDGYTIFMISNTHFVSAALHKKLAYDSLNDFTPVTQITSAPNVLVVHPSLPVKSVNSFFAFARARPGQLSFVVPGVGSLTHLAMEYLMSRTQLRMLHVPYKSTGLGMTDLLSGQIQVMMTGLLPVMPYVQSGRLRAIAVSTAQRWPAQPEIPALAESIAGFDVESWFAFVAPKGTPTAVISRLNTDMNKLLQEPTLRKSFDAQGMSVAGGTSEDVDKRMRSEHDRWAKIIIDAKLRID